jgi:branched-chain amino acid transport system permease protein
MVHFLGTVRIELFYLDLTFMIIALHVVGGTGSLAGAVVGTIVMTGLTEAMHLAEAGVEIDGTTISAPLGLGDVALALIMLLIILFRPKGIMGGREIAWCSGAGGPEGVPETQCVPDKGGPSA